MTKTLPEVLQSSSDFLSALDKTAQAYQNIIGCTSSRMDAVLVLPDDVARRYYEAVYVYNTHFVPNGLSGCGMATGDFLTREDKTYLVLNYGVMVGNVEALHLFRPHEAKLRDWHGKEAGYGERVTQFIAALSETIPNHLHLEAFQNPEQWNSTRAGSEWVGTPNPQFLEALATAATKLGTRKKKGTAALSRAAATLDAELRPFIDFPKTMLEIRNKVEHKGIPYIDGDMLSLSSPKYSGQACLHNKGADDDLMGAMPNKSDMCMTAGQTGWGRIKHFGGGEVQGEDFIMLIPKTPFFPLVQERLNSSEAFMSGWKRVFEIEDLYQSVWEWLEQTRTAKEDIVRQVVPELIASRVLGFNMNMNEEPHVALLRPIVAESALRGNEELLAANNVRVIRKDVETVLVRKGNDVGQLKSIFDEAA